MNPTPPAPAHTAPSQATRQAAARLVAVLDEFCAFIAAHLLASLVLAAFLGPFRTRLQAATAQLRHLAGQPDATAPGARPAPAYPRLLTCDAPRAPRRTRAAGVRQPPHRRARAASIPPATAWATSDLPPAPERPPRHIPPQSQTSPDTPSLAHNISIKG